MELVSYLSKGGLILLGIIFILVGKYLSLRFIIPKIEKYKVLDEKIYVKYSRMQYYIIGFYYIFVGIVLPFINGWSTIITSFGLIIITIPIAIITRNKRKCIERIND